MEREEALSLLRNEIDGVEVWNHRRAAGEGIPEFIRADLSGTDLREINFSLANLAGSEFLRSDLRWALLSNADLNGADLRGAKLNSADLKSANLSGADVREAELRGVDLSASNLSQANLSATDLSEADLTGAKLEGATLAKANLRWTNLTGANLRGADLREANLCEAELSGADLSNSICLRTLFVVRDLSGVLGLDSLRHDGSSQIGIETLVRSKGELPEAFLRACGVPYPLIGYLPSLIGSLQPVQFYSCFISYSAKDQVFAERLYADLTAKGARCWFAPVDLKAGSLIRSKVHESIRIYDKLLLILSENSVRSNWVENEVETAMEQEVVGRKTVLFPIRLDDAVMKIESGWPADIRRSRNIADFRRWKDHDAYQKAFARLLRDLTASESTDTKPT